MTFDTDSLPPLDLVRLTREDEERARAGRRLLQDTRILASLVQRTVRGRMTERAIQNFERTITSRLARVNRDSERTRNEGVAAWLRGAHDLVAEFVALIPPYAPPEIELNVTEWRRVSMLSPYEQGHGWADTRISRVYRHPRKNQLRLYGSGLHRALVTVNGAEPIEVVERGRTGKLFIGTFA